MNERVEEFRLFTAALVGALTGLWGWMGWLFLGWLCCMVLDYLTGTFAALKDGTWSSLVAREGIWHKVGMCAVVAVAIALDLLVEQALINLPVLSLPIEYPGLVAPVVMVWYIITELGSVVENAALMGAPVPQWLRRMLDICKETMDNGGKDEDKT